MAEKFEGVRGTFRGESVRRRRNRRKGNRREGVAIMSAPIAPAVPAHVPQPPAELQRQPLVANYHGFAWISDRVCGLAEGKAPFWWWVCFVPAVLALGMLMFMLSYQISTGVCVCGGACVGGCWGAWPVTAW